MMYRELLVAWIPFVIASLLTPISFAIFSMYTRHLNALYVLGSINVILAIWVFYRLGVSRATVAGVAAGLILGQWWIVQYWLAILLWSIGGFAP